MGRLVDVANHTDQNRIKKLRITYKFSRMYKVYTSTFFNGVVPNKVIKTSATNSHKCKPSPDKIRSQQPKGSYSFTDWIASKLSSLSHQCFKPHRSNSNKRIVFSS